MTILPYRKYKDPEGNLVQLPIVSVQVKCNRVMVPIWGLLDSGADITLLNASFAQLFQIDLRKGKATQLFGVLEGAGFDVYMHQVNIAVKDLGSVDTVVAFTNSEQYPEHMILGRRGFFDHFTVTFKEYMKLVVIEPREYVS